MKLRDSNYRLTLDQLKHAENLSEHKVVFLFSVSYKALYSHIIYIFSILQRTLFTFSSLCGAFNAVLTLSPLHGEGPFLSPCASDTNLSSSNRFMAGIKC